MSKSKLLIVTAVSVVLVSVLTSCHKNEASNTTGWEYNNASNGGFEVAPFDEQMTGPGLVLVEGGSFTMGRTEQDVMGDWDNNPRKVTVSSFYMDETEIRNLDYLEYLHWIYRVFIPADLGVVYRQALPDTLVWRNKLAYNEPYVDYYLRHPAYREYPVVGVSWTQASKYASWRTDRVNEMILVEQGIINLVPEPTAEGYFSTDAYLTYSDYEGNGDNRLQNIVTGEFRNVKIEDGILLPNYRLPTEAEWEFAALGLIGNSIQERILERRIYPWNGHITRTDDNKFYGDFVANTRRGKGDYMGVSGALNDAADITAPVYSFWPNDYGLYNMGGNVAEWVMDVYRATSSDEVNEFRPFRGNVYKTKKVENDEIAERDSVGNVPMVDASDKNDYKISRRRNYRKSDNINFLDGDWASNNSAQKWQSQEANPTEKMYSTDINNVKKTSNVENNSLINDRTRVYKGGSWKDIQYWASPGNRRYLDQDESTDYIGFRCAMVRLGAPVGGRK
jgi:gliding motility-associated lipoprotein GldJ